MENAIEVFECLGCLFTKRELAAQSARASYSQTDYSVIPNEKLTMVTVKDDEEIIAKLPITERWLYSTATHL